MPLQLQLDLRVALRRPLLPSKAVEALLDLGPDGVIREIESGRLEWAWDIRSPDAAKRDLRVWAPCVRHFMDGVFAPIAGDPYAAILPATRAVWRGTDLQRLFTCSETHITHLLDAGELTALNPQRARTISAEIPRLAVLNFLLKRRLT